MMSNVFIFCKKKDNISYKKIISSLLSFILQELWVTYIIIFVFLIF